MSTSIYNSLGRKKGQLGYKTEQVKFSSGGAQAIFFAFAEGCKRPLLIQRRTRLSSRHKHMRQRGLCLKEHTVSGIEGIRGLTSLKYGQL